MAESASAVNASKTRTSVASLRELAAKADPIVLMAGAAVTGAVAGALIPRSPTEKQMLAPIGKNIPEVVKALGTAARQAFFAELAGVPIVGPIAAEQIDRAIDSVVQPVVASSEGVNA